MIKKTKTERDIEKAVKLLEKHGYKIEAPGIPVIMTSKEVAEEKLIKRRDAFIEELRPYLNVYDSTLLNQFFLYWTETNKTKTKMRFELQKTFDVKLRLATWYRNNQSRYGNNYNETQRDQRLRESAELFAKYTGTNTTDTL